MGMQQDTDTDGMPGLSYGSDTDDDIAVATASSGIAATLMPLGRTAHSRYKLPFKPTSTSTCGFSADSRDEETVIDNRIKYIHKYVLKGHD
jgi:hypothetical protein